MISLPKISLYKRDFLRYKSRECVSFDILYKFVQKEEDCLNSAPYILRLFIRFKKKFLNALTPIRLLTCSMSCLLVIVIYIVWLISPGDKVSVEICLPILGLLCLICYIMAQLFLNKTKEYEIHRIEFSNGGYEIFTMNCVKNASCVFPLSSADWRRQIKSIILLIKYLYFLENQLFTVDGLTKQCRDNILDSTPKTIKVVGLYQVKRCDAQPNK